MQWSFSSHLLCFAGFLSSRIGTPYKIHLLGESMGALNGAVSKLVFTLPLSVFKERFLLFAGPSADVAFAKREQLQ